MLGLGFLPTVLPLRLGRPDGEGAGLGCRQDPALPGPQQRQWVCLLREARPAPKASVCVPRVPNLTPGRGVVTEDFWSLTDSGQGWDRPRLQAPLPHPTHLGRTSYQGVRDLRQSRGPGPDKEAVVGWGQHGQSILRGLEVRVRGKVGRGGLLPRPSLLAPALRSLHGRSVKGAHCTEGRSWQGAGSEVETHRGGCQVLEGGWLACGPTGTWSPPPGLRSLQRPIQRL